MGKKSKKKTGKTAGEFTRQQVWNNALKIFKEVCEKLAGPAGFCALSDTSVQLIVHNRYPAIRMRAAAGSGILPAMVKSLDEIFKNMLAREMHISPNGNTVALSSFMREGLMLLHYAELMGTEELPDNPVVKNALSGYDRQGDLYLAAVRTVVQIMCKFCVIMTNWSESIFVYDINQLCAIKGLDGSNEVSVRSCKPESRFLKLEGHSRELIRAGWSNFDGGVSWLDVKPKWLGFGDAEGSDSLCAVYIQRHALQRLEERIGLVPGLMHEAIWDIFRDRDFRWHKRSEKRLIEYKVLNRRLGYLVCSFDQGVVVIRSFLFLTNAGTPEGNRLSELTRLESLDKQYLGIDTLLGFAGFRISEDARLSSLFREAGCEDLLDLDEITRFTKNEVRSQDTEILLNYLSGRDPVPID